MNNYKITPSIWFDNNAFEAMKWYASIFPNSTYTQNSPIVVTAKLSNIPFVGINGGPTFQPNGSVSFMVTLETQDEVLYLWEFFTKEDHQIIMPLQEYPWSSSYGWLKDKYGVHWQIYLGQLESVNYQIITPTLIFPKQRESLCKKALTFYKDLFDDYKSQGRLFYKEAPLQNFIQHAQFVAHNMTMMAADSNSENPEPFNEGVSFVLYCSDQDEIDYYWDKITAKGQESQCGWCKDEFGVSWQVIPHNIDILLASQEAQQAMYQMKKIIIADLKK